MCLLYHIYKNRNGDKVNALEFKLHSHFRFENYPFETMEAL